MIFGDPEYDTLPEPEISTSSVAVTAIRALPEPVTLIRAVFPASCEASTEPLPDTWMSCCPTWPANAIRPEPETLALISSVSSLEKENRALPSTASTNAFDWKLLQVIRPLCVAVILSRSGTVSR